MCGCGKDCLILIPFRLPQINCFSFRLICFSSDSDSCPNVGIGPLLQFSHWLRAGPVLLKLLFPPLVPSSYQVLPGSVYSFPLVRYSCLLLAGVLHGLLCLKVYSWYIRGERCTPRPPTPPPSCSLLKLIFNLLLLKAITSQGNRTHNLYPMPGIFHTCVISCPGWLLWSPNSFCSPHSKSVNLRQGVEISKGLQHFWCY